MSYLEDEPVCPRTCRCGCWSPCPGWIGRQFSQAWTRIAHAYAETCEGTPPTRRELVLRRLGRGNVPRAVVVIRNSRTAKPQSLRALVKYFLFRVAFRTLRA